MLWTLLIPMALAGRWDDHDPDVMAWRVVPAEPEVVWDTLADTHSLEQLFPHACAQDWVHGDQTQGVGAQVTLTYRWDVVRRRLEASIAEGREGAWFDLEHEGDKGFVTRFSTDAVDGGTRVTIHTWVSPPPWPFQGRYFRTIQPVWTQCYVAALSSLEDRLEQQPARVEGKPPVPPPPKAVAPPPPPGPTAVVWTSPSCGERAYERRFTLAPDFRYQGMDLVSPCPPDARCVWSGIVHFSGRWAMEDGDLVLAETQAEEGPGVQPRPSRLRGDGTRFYEGDCAYDKGPPSAGMPVLPVQK